MAVLKRQPLFPHVIELNHQARRRVTGCSVYLIYDDQNNWALVDIGYSGYVGHEFIPTRDCVTGLKEAIAWCDV